MGIFIEQDKQVKTEFNKTEKYRIPPELIYSLFLE